MTSTNANKLSLTALKVHAALSEETLCFTCNVLWDGRKIGVASNRGCGGMTDIHFTGSKADIEAAKAYADQAPVLEDDGTQMMLANGQPMFLGLDGLVDELACELDMVKRITSYLKRVMKTKTVAHTGGKELVFSAAYSTAVAGKVREKYPDAVVLNELPIEEAVRKSFALAKEQVAALSKG